MKKIETGCIVMFKEVMDKGDEKTQMVVVDDYGESSRCKVRILGTGRNLSLSYVYHKEDLKVIVSAEDVKCR